MSQALDDRYFVAWTSVCCFVWRASSHSRMGIRLVNIYALKVSLSVKFIGFFLSPFCYSLFTKNQDRFSWRHARWRFSLATTGPASF
jgi:hypothetical protein